MVVVVVVVVVVVMIEVILNDRLGKKIRVKCNEDDTIGDLKKLVAAQTGTRPEKIRCVSLSLSLSLSFAREEGKKKRPFDTASPTFLRTDDASNIFSLSLSLKRRRRRRRRRRKVQKWYTIYKDHITLDDYEVKDGSNLELYYN